MKDENVGIILFDGVCNLCNSFVQKIIAADKNNHFKFASLQSEVGQKLLADKPEFKDLKTIIYLEGEQLYTRSTAALKISKHLGGFWPVLQVGYILPVFIRNGIYNLIAKNRYKWFGKMDQCMIPTPELKEKFL
jgi:predicted DCC family thiol-disulfide oxidoreductase YuxK